jgi:hypothetical protein
MPRSEPRLETGLSLFFFARPDQFTPNSFKMTLFPLGEGTHAAEAARKRGEKHTKEGDFAQKQGKK